MSRFLLDAILSPETRENLAAKHGLDVVDLDGRRVRVISAEG